MKKNRFSHFIAVLFIFTLFFLMLVCPLFVYSQDSADRVHEGGTITVACPEKIRTLDPQKAELASEVWIIEQIYDALLEYDPNNRIVPVLAEALPERLGEYEYLLRLRPGIEFHDGTPLDANDVVFTLKRLLDPTTQSPTREVFQNITSAQAISPLTIKFTVGPDCPDLLELLTRVQMRPMPKEAVMKHGTGYGRISAIGTGPFKMIEWDRENKIILERNYSYKLGKPFVHRIIFNFPKPDVDVIRELRYGRIELIPNLSPRQASSIASKPYVRLEHKSGQRICQIYLNLERFPFNSLNIRRAVSLSINRQEIAKDAYYGFATPAGSSLPAWHRFFEPGAQKQFFDPNQALKILAEEGFTQDFPLSFSLIYTNSEPFRRIAQIIKEQLAHVGIQVHLISMAKKDLFDFVYGTDDRDRGLFQAALEDWEDWRGGGDAAQFLWRLYHHSSPQNKLGTITFAWEKDLAWAVRECNPDLRQFLFKRSAAMIDQEIVTIFLCYPHRVWVARSWVRGEDFCNCLGNLFLERVWVR